MFNYISWKWKNSRRWEKRNIIWTLLFIASIFIGVTWLTVAAGSMLILDAIFSAMVDSYYNYKRSLISGTTWQRKNQE